MTVDNLDPIEVKEDGILYGWILLSKFHTNFTAADSSKVMYWVSGTAKANPNIHIAQISNYLGLPPGIIGVRNILSASRPALKEMQKYNNIHGTALLIEPPPAVYMFTTDLFRPIVKFNALVTKTESQAMTYCRHMLRTWDPQIAVEVLRTQIVLV